MSDELDWRFINALERVLHPCLELANLAEAKYGAANHLLLRMSRGDFVAYYKTPTAPPREMHERIALDVKGRFERDYSRAYAPRVLTEPLNYETETDTDY